MVEMLAKMNEDLGTLLNFCKEYDICVEVEAGRVAGMFLVFTKDDIKRKLFISNLPSLVETDDKDILDELLFWCDYMIESKTNELRKNVKKLVIEVVKNDKALDMVVDFLIQDEEFMKALKEVAEQ